MPTTVSQFQVHPFVLCFVRLEERLCKPHFHFACCLSIGLCLSKPRGDCKVGGGRKGLFLLVFLSGGNSFESHSSNTFTLAAVVPSHSSSEMQLTVFPTRTKAVSLHHFRDTSTNQQAPASQALSFQP